MRKDKIQKQKENTNKSKDVYPPHAGNPSPPERPACDLEMSTLVGISKDFGSPPRKPWALCQGVASRVPHSALRLFVAPSCPQLAAVGNTWRDVRLSHVLPVRMLPPTTNWSFSSLEPTFSLPRTPEVRPGKRQEAAAPGPAAHDSQVAPLQPAPHQAVAVGNAVYPQPGAARPGPPGHQHCFLPAAASPSENSLGRPRPSAQSI